MNKALYIEYAELEKTRDVIETRQKTLKFEMLDEMKAELPEGKNGVEMDVGSFTLQKKITYKFSKTTKALQKQVEDAKAEEIAKGTAKPEKVVEYVVFRPVKIVVE